MQPAILTHAQCQLRHIRYLFCGPFHAHLIPSAPPEAAGSGPVARDLRPAEAARCRHSSMRDSQHAVAMSCPPSPAAARCPTQFKARFNPGPAPAAARPAPHRRFLPGAVTWACVRRGVVTSRGGVAQWRSGGRCGRWRSRSCCRGKGEEEREEDDDDERRPAEGARRRHFPARAPHTHPGRRSRPYPPPQGDR